jgi:hypothetical protein
VAEAGAAEAGVRGVFSTGRLSMPVRGMACGAEMMWVFRRAGITQQHRPASGFEHVRNHR